MKRFLALLVFALFVAGTLTSYSFYLFLSPPPPAEPEAKIVRIQPGMGLRPIARVLAEEGLIRDPFKFMLLAWWKGVGKKIQWGDFEIHTGEPPLTVLDYLTSGKTLLKQVTIPEGFTLKQVAERLAHQNLAVTEDFLASARDRVWLTELGLPGNSLEGFLFPDTYIFHRGMPVRSIQKRMVTRFREVYERCRSNGAGDAPLDLNLNQMVTLASIVEKETGQAGERPLIASVFYNRLRQGMALQSDPTVIYGIKDFNGDLTKKDLQRATPYNTYVIQGLPPGPIANPGEYALRAVFSPAKTDYLYFVSKNDGSHYFSRNIQEHNRAVVRYQLSDQSEAAAPNKKNRR
ncbi:MAG: endolytic transglycosylase MltG [Desulfobacteraceae bacterium]|nr:MAG: endolytic transglycosylase MltG [Desulfobacteraceae bacterium]